MAWKEAFGLLLLLSLAYPSVIAAAENKQLDIDPPNGDEASRKVELSKEGIMFGNQQNKPAAVVPPPDDDMTGSDGGTDDNTAMKSDNEGKTLQGNDEKDYQYDEPYALFRKKREVDGMTGKGKKRARQRRRPDNSQSGRNKRSARNFFDDPEGPDRDHFLTADQIPEFYQNIEPKDANPFPERKLDEEVLRKIAEELYQEMQKQQSPLQVIGINADDTYNTRYGSTLPAYNQQPYLHSDALEDWSDAETPDKQIEELARLYELAMILAMSDKTERN